MNRPARLVIVRHAQSLRNLKKRGSVYFCDDEARSGLRGTPDYKIPLTEDGHQQSLITGEGLREDYGVFDYVYDSGYKRTIQSRTNILSAYTRRERARMRIRSNPFIRERDPGFTYDMTEDEAEMNFPWLQEYWRTHGGFFANPPGGESLAAVAERVYMFINMLFRDRIGDNVLVVTHGGTIRAFRFLLERWTYEQALRWPKGQSPKNCGVTVYEYDPSVQRLVLKEYNRTYWKWARAQTQNNKRKKAA